MMTSAGVISIPLPLPFSLLLTVGHPYRRREDLENSRMFSKVHLQALTVTAVISFVNSTLFLNLPAPPKHCGAFDTFDD